MTWETAKEVVGTAAIGLLAAAVWFYAWPEEGAGDGDLLQEAAVSSLGVGWNDLVAIAGHHAGAPGAPLRLVVLSDFQCPVCRSFHQHAESLVSARPGRVELMIVHHPLGYHDWAFEAAVASECVRVQAPDRFAEMVNALYGLQDRSDHAAWGSIAREAGVADWAQVEQCVADGTRSHLVDRGLSIGAQIGLEGTPTVVLEGLLFDRPPSLERLLQVTDSLLALNRDG